MDDINTSKDIKKQKINFNWDDPFCLDEQLTVDEKLIRDTAKSYASQKLMPAPPELRNRASPDCT